MRERWEIKKLNEVCQIRPPKKLAKDLLCETDLVSFVPMNILGIGQKHFQPEEEKELSTVSSSYTYFQDGDVLLAKITPCFENGKLGIAKGLTNGIGFGSSEFIVYRSLNNLNSEYLYYFLSQQSFRDNGKTQMKGAVGHKRISKEFYENSLLPIPPLIEQKQIVEILDEAFAAIDQAKANIEKNIQNAKELFQSKLNNIFSQKGAGWEEKTLGEVCYVLNGYAFKSKEAIEESTTQLLRMGNLYKNVLDLDRKPVFYPDSYIENHKDLLLKEGDLIMSLTGTVGKTDYGYTVKLPKTEVNLLLNQRIMKIEVHDSNILNKDYLKNYLLSPDFLFRLYDTASGTRQANLSSRTILNLKINYPSNIEEQLKVVFEFKQLRENTVDIESTYLKKLRNLEELKKSILEKAFAGELTNKMAEV